MSVPLLRYMIITLIDNGMDMPVRKRVVNGFAFSSGFDEVCVFQRFQLMGYGGLRHAQVFRDGAYAHFAFGKRV